MEYWNTGIKDWKIGIMEHWNDGRENMEEWNAGMLESWGREQ